MDVQRIWDFAPHNAFTDLVRFKDHFYCVFREGEGHVSPDGALRVLASASGEQWHSVALIQASEADLRDAKICVTPDQQLMLYGAAALHPPANVQHQTRVWFSDDGHHWSDSIDIGDPDVWIWRITWHQGVAYGIGYSTGTDCFLRLYRSEDGIHFTTHVDRLYDTGYANETSIVFMEDGTALCLLRRDDENPVLHTAQLGQSAPPYTEWIWKDLGIRFGGPHMVHLPDGRLIAAGRQYQYGGTDQRRTVLCLLDPEAVTLEEMVCLPSGGDTSYPGLVWHDDQLWVSYYAGHEGKTSIYMAHGPV
jgi:hypothetical protein